MNPRTIADNAAEPAAHRTEIRRRSLGLQRSCVHRSLSSLLPQLLRGRQRLLAMCIEHFDVAIVSKTFSCKRCVYKY